MESFARDAKRGPTERKSMGSMNWNKCKKPGASYSPNRQLALKFQRKAKVPATDKQKNCMTKLGIDFPKNVTKWQAMGMISKTIEKIRELEKNINRELQQAIDRD